MSIEQIENVYYHFRKAQADYNNRGFRMPKDFERHFKNRFKEINQKKLAKITNWFSTKWSNIDPYLYFKCGFDLFGKQFSYVKFFDSKILKLYIQRDKNEKRQVRVRKEKLIKSAKYVKKFMQKNYPNILTLQDYIHYSDGNQKIAVTHYLKNKIDASFFVFLIKRGMKLTDTERGYVPYVSQHYRNINIMLSNMKSFLDKIEERIEIKPEDQK